MSPTSVPVLSLEPLDQRDDDDDGGRPQRASRSVVGMVLATLVVLIVLSVLTSLGSGDPGSDAQDRTPGTTASTVAPTPSSRPTSPSPPDPPRTGSLTDGRFLDPAFGFSAVVVSQQGAITVVDLSNGATNEITSSLEDVLEWMVWTGETVLARSGNGLRRLRMDGSDLWDAVDTAGYDQIYPSGVGGTLLVYSGPASPSYGSVPATGPAMLQVRAVPTAVVAMDAMNDGDHIVGTLDGVWLIPRSGESRRLGYGTLLGASRSRVVRQTCETLDTCQLVVDDLERGTQAVLASFPSDVPVVGAVPSPDGSSVAVVISETSESTWLLRVLPADGSSPFDVDLGRGWFDHRWFHWSSDGDGVVWWDPTGRVIRSIRWRNGDVSVKPAELWIGSQDSAMVSNPAAQLLIPLAELPPGWAPTPPG